MDADQILAFRLARSGLAVRGARNLADAVACPASDYARDAALLLLKDDMRALESPPAAKGIRLDEAALVLA